MAIEAQHALKMGHMTASVDLSGSQFKLVNISGAGTVALNTAVTDVTIGVLQNKPTSTNPAEILVVGVTKMLAGGTIAAGDFLTTSTSGTAVKWIVGTSTTAYVIGRALTAAVSGDIFVGVVSCITGFRGITGI